MALTGAFGTPSFTASTLALSSSYRVTRINPNSIRDILASIDEEAKIPPYPRRHDAQWWMIWHGDEPVAYVVGKSWELDQAYAVCHYSCVPEHLTFEAWVALFTAVIEYTQEEDHSRTFVIARDPSLYEALNHTGFSKVGLDDKLSRYVVWERKT